MLLCLPLCRALHTQRKGHCSSDQGADWPSQSARTVHSTVRSSGTHPRPPGPPNPPRRGHTPRSDEQQERVRRQTQHRRGAAPAQQARDKSDRCCCSGQSHLNMPSTHVSVPLRGRNGAAESRSAGSAGSVTEIAQCVRTGLHRASPSPLDRRRGAIHGGSVLGDTRWAILRPGDAAPRGRSVASSSRIIAPTSGPPIPGRQRKSAKRGLAGSEDDI